MYNANYLLPKQVRYQTAPRPEPMFSSTYKKRNGNIC